MPAITPYLLALLEQLQVQADEVQVALWRGVEAAPELSKEPATGLLNRPSKGSSTGAQVYSRCKVLLVIKTMAELVWQWIAAEVPP
jgi:hypothetical protein